MAKSTSGGGRGRRQKSPATIDLEANRVEAEKPLESSAAETVEIATDDKEAVMEDDKAGSTVGEAVKAGPSHQDAIADESGAAKSAAEDETAPWQSEEPHSASADMSAEPAVASPAGSGRGTSFLGGLVAAVLGGAVALGGAEVLSRAGVTGGAPAGGQASVEMQQEIDRLREAIAGLEQRVQDGGSAEALAERVAALESAPADGAGDAQLADELRQRIEALEARPSGTGAEGGMDLTPLQSRLDALEAEFAQSADTVASRLDTLAGQVSGGAGVTNAINENAAAIASIDERLAALEATVNSQVLPAMSQVQDAAQAAMAGQKIARSVSARGLSAVLENGGAFATELSAAEALIGTTPEIEQLRDLAGSGVETAAQLLASFDPVANRLLAAEEQPDGDATVMDRFMASARSLVTVRPSGPVEGDSAGAILSRVEDALRQGESAAALAEWESLPQELREKGSEWAGALASRVEAEMLIRAVVAQLSAQAG